MTSTRTVILLIGLMGFPLGAMAAEDSDVAAARGLGDKIVGRMLAAETEVQKLRADLAAANQARDAAIAALQAAEQKLAQAEAQKQAAVKAAVDKAIADFRAKVAAVSFP